MHWNPNPEQRQERGFPSSWSSLEHTQLPSPIQGGHTKPSQLGLDIPRRILTAISVKSTRKALGNCQLKNAPFLVIVHINRSVQFTLTARFKGTEVPDIRLGSQTDTWDRHSTRQLDFFSFYTDNSRDFSFRNFSFFPPPRGKVFCPSSEQSIP